MSTIFRYFIFENRMTLTYIVWFVDSFSSKDFSGLEKLIYLFLEYCARLGVIGKKKYLEAFLRTDGKSLILEHSIKLDNMGVYDYNDPSALEQAFRTISTAIIAFYDEVMQQDMTDREFKVDMDTWMSKQKSVLVQKTITDNFPRFQQGDRVDDVTSDMQLDFDRIMQTYDRAKLDSLEFLDEKDGLEDDGICKKLANTYIPVIDGDAKGIFATDIITMTGLTGSGKTRFAMRIAYNVAVLDGKSIRIDSLELSKKQIKYMLVAMHIITMFRGEVKIPDSLMDRSGLTNEQMPYYKAAKEDLFNNPKYGKIYIYDDKLEVDKYYNKMKTWLRLHKDTKIIFIDYAGNVKVSKDVRTFMKKADMIEVLYETVSDLNKFAGTGFFILNQYNKEGAVNAAAGKKIDQGDIQGGQTVHKWTTYNIYTCQTPEQKAANRMDMTVDKARFASGFSRVPFELDLSISKFTQLRKEVVN